MSRREELLAVIKAAKHVEFIELVKLHNCRNDTFDLGETIQSLSRKQYSEMWDGLNEMCTKVLSVDLESEPELDEEASEVELQHHADILIGIVTTAICSITVPEPIVTSSLLQVAIMLHGILLAMPSSFHKLQSLTAYLCETWFLSDLDGKDELVTSMLPFFIIRGLSQGAVPDVKRLWSLRQGLLLIDFEDESSSSLKSLLQQCLMHSVFLTVEEGRKFLGYLFGLHLTFIDDLHKTIKNQLPSCPIESLVLYAEVYFKAWRAAKDSYLEKIEIKCIQDLMFHAIHAQCTGRNSMASRIKKVLGYFHQHKKHPEVDKVLLKLYEPIIWRACKVANPSVRANAAGILFDVFPLQDPDANVAQTDQLLQRQFDVIGDFLDDPSPTVRATAIHGVFHITALFWELIPGHIVKELISKIVQSLAFDVSSVAVRVAVFKGINYVLDNRLCHPLLKTLLPNLKNLIHDNSEKVRIAFLDVLLKIKGIRAIKFWTITPIEHLLGRLEVEESSAVIGRLVKLLMSSFHPTKKENEGLLTRCVELWNANPRAARKFYQYAHLQISLTAAGIDKENDETAQMGTDDTQDDIIDVDIGTMAGLLETCVIVWEGIKDQLEQPAQESLKMKLTQHFSKAIPKLLQSLEDNRCQSALTLLAAHLPSSHIPKLSRSFLSVLSSMAEESTSEVYGPLLECLCSWDKASDIVELMNERLRNGLQDDVVQENQSSKKRKSVNFTLPLTKSLVALDFLDWLMTSQTCRTHIFEAGDCLKVLTGTLSSSMDSIERYLQEGNTNKEKIQLLKKAFEMYCRVRIHLYAKENESGSEENSSTPHETVIAAFKQVLLWSERVLLHIDYCSESDDQSGSERSKRGRGYQESQTDEFINSSLKNLLSLLSELVMLGVSKTQLNSSLVRFTSSLVEYEKSITLLPEITKLLYQIALEIAHVDDNSPVDLSPITVIFGNILKSATSYHHLNKLQILTSLRPPLIEVVKMSHQNGLFMSENLNNTLMMIIIETIIKELVAVIKQNPLITDGGSKNSLPVTSNFLFEFILKSKSLLRVAVTETLKCITSGVLRDKEYQAVAFLLWIVINDGNIIDDIKPCLLEMEKTLGTFPADDSEIPQYVPESRRLIRDSYKKLEEVVS